MWQRPSVYIVVLVIKLNSDKENFTGKNKTDLIQLFQQTDIEKKTGEKINR